MKTFNSHRFKSSDLKESVPLRTQAQQNEDSTRFGNSNNNTNYDLTGVSETGLVMDPEDKERAGEELVAFKVSVDSSSCF